MGRTECKAEAYALETTDGFQCPPSTLTPTTAPTSTSASTASPPESRAASSASCSMSSPTSVMLLRMYLNAKTTTPSLMRMRITRGGRSKSVTEEDKNKLPIWFQCRSLMRDEKLLFKNMLLHY